MHCRSVDRSKWEDLYVVLGVVHVHPLSLIPTQASLVLSAVFCILFGTSQSYYMAIVWRFCLGMVNSITSTTKTLASEIGHGSEDKERRAMGLVIGMRSWGFLIGPAIGGALAEPLSQYPNVSWLQRDGWWHIVLEKFPFLLPNLVVAICCLGGAASAAWFIEETLSAKRDWTMRHYLDEAAGDLATCWEQCSQRLAGCCRRPGVSNGDSESQTLLQKDSANIQYGQATISNEPNASASSEKLSIWSRIATRQLLIVNWLFSFVVTFIDEAFPLFCISNVGGLGLSEASIAKILSLAGLVFAALQYIVYVTITDRVGLYSSIEIGCFLGLVPAGLIPLSVWFWRRSGYDTTFNDSQLEGPHLSLLILFYLGILLGFCKIMTCMCFASLSIATNKTVPPCQRAEMNGLCVVGSSIAKGAAPIFGGALVSFSFSSSLAVVPHEYGSVVIFSTIALLGFWVTCRTLRLDRSFNVII